MDWKIVFELFLKYGPEVLKLILELINKEAGNRAAAARNFNAAFLAATKMNDWRGMMLMQICNCVMTLPEESFNDFVAGIERVASGMAAAGEALQAAK